MRRRFQKQYPVPYDIDSPAVGHDTLDTAKRAWLRQLRLQLSLDYDVLPPEIIVKVDHIASDPDAGGGYADIFRGSYMGQVVAIKRLRIFSSTSLSEKERNVRDSFLLI